MIQKGELVSPYEAHVRKCTFKNTHTLTEPCTRTGYDIPAVLILTVGEGVAAKEVEKVSTWCGRISPLVEECISVCLCVPDSLCFGAKGFDRV